MVGGPGQGANMGGSSFDSFIASGGGKGGHGGGGALPGTPMMYKGDSLMDNPGLSAVLPADEMGSLVGPSMYVVANIEMDAMQGVNMDASQQLTPATVGESFKTGGVLGSVDLEKAGIKFSGEYKGLATGGDGAGGEHGEHGSGHGPGGGDEHHASSGMDADRGNIGGGGEGHHGLGGGHGEGLVGGSGGQGHGGGHHGEGMAGGGGEGGRSMAGGGGGGGEKPGALGGEGHYIDGKGSQQGGPGGGGGGGGGGPAQGGGTAFGGYMPGEGQRINPFSGALSTNTGGGATSGGSDGGPREGNRLKGVLNNPENLMGADRGPAQDMAKMQDLTQGFEPSLNERTGRASPSATPEGPGAARQGRVGF